MTEQRTDWAKAKAFNVVTSHGDFLLDDYPLDDLIEEVARAIDEAKEFGASEWRSRLMSVVHVAGGSVEGHPTSTINILQRIRELVATEGASPQ